MGWSRVTLPMWRPRGEIRASDTLVDTTIDATADAGSIPAVSMKLHVQLPSALWFRVYRGEWARQNSRTASLTRSGCSRLLA